MKYRVQVDDEDTVVISAREGGKTRVYYLILGDDEVHLGCSVDGVAIVGSYDMTVPAEVFAMMVDEYRRKWGNELLSPR